MTWLPCVAKVWMQETVEGAPLVIVAGAGVQEIGLATSSESLKDTVPDGAVADPGKIAPLLAGKVTVAVRVTGVLTVEGFCCEATVVVVGAAETVCTTLELLVVKFESPL